MALRCPHDETKVCMKGAPPITYTIADIENGASWGFACTHECMMKDLEGLVAHIEEHGSLDGFNDNTNPTDPEGDPKVELTAILEVVTPKVEEVRDVLVEAFEDVEAVDTEVVVNFKNEKGGHSENTIGYTFEKSINDGVLSAVVQAAHNNPSQIYVQYACSNPNVHMGGSNLTFAAESMTDETIEAIKNHTEEVLKMVAAQAKTVSEREVKLA